MATTKKDVWDSIDSDEELRANQPFLNPSVKVVRKDNENVVSVGKLTYYFKRVLGEHEFEAIPKSSTIIFEYNPASDTYKTKKDYFVPTNMRLEGIDYDNDRVLATRIYNLNTFYILKMSDVEHKLGTVITKNPQRHNPEEKFEVIKQIRLENHNNEHKKDGSVIQHHKFYELRILKGEKTGKIYLKKQWGSIGSPREPEYSVFGSLKRTDDAFEKKVKDEIKKGYEETSASARLQRTRIFTKKIEVAKSSRQATQERRQVATAQEAREKALEEVVDDYDDVLEIGEKFKHLENNITFKLSKRISAIRTSDLQIQRLGIGEEIELMAVNFDIDKFVGLVGEGKSIYRIVGNYSDIDNDIKVSYAIKNPQDTEMPYCEDCSEALTEYDPVKRIWYCEKCDKRFFINVGTYVIIIKGEFNRGSKKVKIVLQVVTNLSGEQRYTIWEKWGYNVPIVTRYFHPTRPPHGIGIVKKAFNDKIDYIRKRGYEPIVTYLKSEEWAKDETESLAKEAMIPKRKASTKQLARQRELKDEIEKNEYKIQGEKICEAGIIFDLLLKEFKITLRKSISVLKIPSLNIENTAGVINIAGINYSVDKFIGRNDKTGIKIIGNYSDIEKYISETIILQNPQDMGMPYCEDCYEALTELDPIKRIWYCDKCNDKTIVNEGTYVILTEREFQRGTKKVKVVLQRLTNLSGRKSYSLWEKWGDKPADVTPFKYSEKREAEKGSSDNKDRSPGSKSFVRAGITFYSVIGTINLELLKAIPLMNVEDLSIEPFKGKIEVKGINFDDDKFYGICKAIYEVIGDFSDIDSYLNDTITIKNPGNCIRCYGPTNKDQRLCKECKKKNPDDPEGMNTLADPILVVPGAYKTPDGIIYVVKPTKDKQRLYAKRLVESSSRLTESGKFVDFDFKYEKGAIFKLRPRHQMTLDDAKDLMIRYGRCIMCGRKLKVGVSVERGLGPVCVKYFKGSSTSGMKTVTRTSKSDRSDAQDVGDINRNPEMSEILYHGTNHFAKKEILKNGFEVGHYVHDDPEFGGMYGDGVYFSDSKKFIDKNIKYGNFTTYITAKVHLENPYIFDTEKTSPDKWIEELRDLGISKGIKKKAIVGKDITEILQANGYDGIFATSSKSNEIVVFDLSKIQIIRENPETNRYKKIWDEIYIRKMMYNKSKGMIEIQLTKNLYPNSWKLVILYQMGGKETTIFNSSEIKAVKQYGDLVQKMRGEKFSSVKKFNETDIEFDVPNGMIQIKLDKEVQVLDVLDYNMLVMKKDQKISVTGINYNTDKFVAGLSSPFNKNGYTVIGNYSDIEHLITGTVIFMNPSKTRNQIGLQEFNTLPLEKMKEYVMNVKEITVEIAEAIGIELEMEHTNNRKVALSIARDHIKEFGSVYYKELVEMEDKLIKKQEDSGKKMNSAFYTGDRVLFSSGPFLGRTVNVTAVEPSSGKVWVFLMGKSMEVPRSMIRRIREGPSGKKNPESKAEQRYEIWNKRESEKTSKLSVPWEVQNITQLGKIIQMDYESDKWNSRSKMEYYYHPIEKNHPILGSFQFEGKTYFVICGIQEAKPEGLVETEDSRRAMTGRVPPAPSDIAQLGKWKQIIYLDWSGSIQHIVFHKKTYLCSSADGRWIYVVMT